jgi:hypothetical protein
MLACKKGKNCLYWIFVTVYDIHCIDISICFVWPISVNVITDGIMVFF